MRQVRVGGALVAFALVVLSIAGPAISQRPAVAPYITRIDPPAVIPTDGREAVWILWFTAPSGGVSHIRLVPISTGGQGGDVTVAANVRGLTQGWVAFPTRCNGANGNRYTFNVYLFAAALRLWSPPYQIWFTCQAAAPAPRFHNATPPRIVGLPNLNFLQAGETRAVGVDFFDPDEVVYRITVLPAPGSQTPGFAGVDAMIALRNPGEKEYRFYLTCTVPGTRYALRATLYYYTVAPTSRLNRNNASTSRDFSFPCLGPTASNPGASPARITGIRLANPAGAVIHGDSLTGRVYLADPSGVVRYIRITASGAAAAGAMVTAQIPVTGPNDPSSGIPFYFSCSVNGPVRLVFTLFDREKHPFAPVAYDLHCI